jgi:hypothetical protein
MSARLSLCFVFFVSPLILFSCAVPSSNLSPASQPSGTILFKDDFSSPASGWDHTKYAEGIMDYYSGGYRMMVNELQANFWATPQKDFGDVRIEMDAGKLGGPDENRIGLICRFNGDSYYFFIVSSDGYYGLGVFTKDETNLIGQNEMQYSDKIKTGANVNHLRADCNGDTLSFYANGFPLAEVHDPTLTHGDVGLLTGTFDQPGVDIIYDNFIVMKP